jgi:hypothetical protein
MPNDRGDADQRDDLAILRAEIASVARALKVLATGPVDPSVTDFGFPLSLEERLRAAD